MGLFDNLFGKKEEFFLELGDAKDVAAAEASKVAPAPVAKAPKAAPAPAAAAKAVKVEQPAAPAAAPAAKPAVEAPLAPAVETVNFATEFVGVAARTPRRRPGVAMGEFLTMAETVGRR